MKFPKGMTPLEEAMVLHGKTPDGFIKVSRRLSKDEAPKPPPPPPPAYCPGRSVDEPCKHGHKDKYGVRHPARLGITVDQASDLEQMNGTPPRCFKCSANPDPKEEVSP